MSRDIFPRPQGGRGCFRASSPQPCVQRVPVMLIVVGPLAPAARQRIPVPSVFMLVIVTTPFVFLKRTSSVVARLATKVLSETRGLLLSSVIRGGIGLKPETRCHKHSYQHLIAASRSFAGFASAAT